LLCRVLDQFAAIPHAPPKRHGAPTEPIARLPVCRVASRNSVTGCLTENVTGSRT
jgi:hypothetical protein